MEPTEGPDFFISYTHVDLLWARWIAVQLEAAGYTTVLQDFDFRPGSDFIHQMQTATSTAARTIAVLSPGYFGSEFSEAEWRVAFAKDPAGDKGLLIPVRVQLFQPPGLLRTRVYVDLVDTDESTCRQKLLAAVTREWARPTTAVFPGEAASHQIAGLTRFPGTGPEVSNLPRRNRNFSGRDNFLDQVHADLQAASTATLMPIVAVHGLGGIGKTGLALEYAHRYGSEYDVTWWVPAEEPTAALSSLAELAARLGCPEQADRVEMVNALFDLLRTRDGWLLVYDNAEQPAQLSGLLPRGGAGHVLVTSRWHAWAHDATPLQLGAFSRVESIDFLRRRSRDVDVDELELKELAELLGDLPLALEEAAAYLEETGETVGAYIELVLERSRELFGLDQRVGEHTDRRRIATVWSISIDRVKQEEPVAESLLNLGAFMAPEIPRDLEGDHPEVLPDDLASVISDRLAYNRIVAVIGRYSLVMLTPKTITIHRLVQAVIRARLDPAKERLWAEAAVDLVWQLFPEHSHEVETWSECERLLPQALAVSQYAEDLGVARWSASDLLRRASIYLRRRGMYRQAEPLAERAVEFSEDGLGPDDLSTASCREELGRVLYGAGDFAGARAQLEQALLITEATLGSDDPDLADMRGVLGLVLHALGDSAGARTELERALKNPRTKYRMFSDEITDLATLHSNLGEVLRDMGDLQGARAELERALQINKATPYSDQLGTATTHRRLSDVLRDLGDVAGARAELELALQIGGDAVGPDHPEVQGFRQDLNSLSSG